MTTARTYDPGIAAPVIQITHLKKAFGDNIVLRDFNLNVYAGENVVVMGRSGIGKTVLIKCIIGLVKADGGTLRILGKEISTIKHNELDELRTHIGFIFQNGALYDSMTVRENLEFALRRQAADLKKQEIDKRVFEVLENVGLERAIDLMPAELSGGMRKRISIARSLILNPEIILYDEPTTGLDPITSSEITHLILDLQQKYRTTSVIITHDIELAKRTANRIVFIMDGIASKEGTYEELQHSDDPEIKRFFKQ
jgi:phospholipid/cholesterol/gamma-HCH transport system ATP-binding protein